jgi:predicted nucleotidyltransferase
MAQPENDLKGLQDYIRYAQNYIKIEKVVLFGSHARGSASPESDIDIAIVSPDLGKSVLHEKMNLNRWRRKAAVTIDLQPFPFSPEQFEGDHFFCRGNQEKWD